MMNQFSTSVAVALGTGVLLGYWIGIGASLGYTRSTATTNDAGADKNSDEAEEDDDEGDNKVLSTIKTPLSPFEELKQVLVVRTDLKMGHGKIAAQCSHATLACYKALQKGNPTLLKHWERIGQAKIVLQCGSEDELLLLQAQATSLGICARSIQDAGRTQIAAGSRTVVGIGPAPKELINQVTGHLKLL